MMFIQSNSSLINHFEIHQYLEVRLPSSSPVDEQQTVFRDNPLVLNAHLKEDSAMCQRLLDDLKRDQTFQEFPGFAWRCLPFVPWMNSEVAYIAGERCAPRLRLTPVPAGTKKLQTLGRKVPDLWGSLWSTGKSNGIQINFIRFTYPLSDILRFLQLWRFQNHFLTPGSFSRWKQRW